jgi:hypothetical protein
MLGFLVRFSWMSKARCVATIAATALLLSCGQEGGVHALSLKAFQVPVATSPVAHGQSARTRHATPAPIPTPPHSRHVEGGRLHVRVPPPQPAPSGVVVVSYEQWTSMFLRRINAPVCVNNLVSVVAWAEQEGTRAGWNPLATTLYLPGATQYNPVGVRNYATLEQGLDATVLTLQKGWTAHGYSEIVAALQHCADPMETAIAINASDWCRGCAGGNYVTGVVPRIIAAYNLIRSSD